MDRPPVGFHFSVSFDALGGVANDIRFQSVSGLNAELETENLVEGGENRFQHVVPVRSKFSDLVLKRGLFKPGESGVTDWCKAAFEEFNISPIDLQVTLLNEKHEPLVYWKVIHAWPKAWKLGDMNAERGEVLIETFELNYNRFEIKS